MVLPEFKNICIGLQNDIASKFQIDNEKPTFLSINRVIDSEAMKLQYSCPDGMHLYPAVVPTDGDCLAYCVTVFTNITPEEVRVRMTIESISQENLYLNHEFLNFGRDASSDLPLAYAQYSDYYTPGERLDAAGIRRCYEKEVLTCLSTGQYMGIWQLHAIASVMGLQVNSVYFNGRGMNVRQHLHRLIWPRQFFCNDTVKIMWTSTRNDKMTPVHWIPNHFAPLLPTSLNTRNVVLEQSTVPSIECVSFDQFKQSFFLCQTDIMSIMATMNDTDTSSVNTHIVCSTPIPDVCTSMEVVCGNAADELAAMSGSSVERNNTILYEAPREKKYFYRGQRCRD